MGFSWGMIRTFHINVILAPTFDGCLDPWILITWLSKMNQFFDQVYLSYIVVKNREIICLHKIKEEREKKYDTMNLRGSAICLHPQEATK